MDAIRGKMMNIIYLTIPLLIVFTVNMILYALTYYRLQMGSKRLNTSRLSSRTKRVARNMILFLLAFFVQYWAAAVFGACQLITDNVPTVILYFLTSFTNIGGFLNGIVYLVIRHRFLARQRSPDKTSIDKVKRSGDVSPNVMRSLRINQQEGPGKSDDNILANDSST